MSLSASYWGGHIWKTMYILAYTCSDVNLVISALSELLKVLPCEKCRQDVETFMTTNPLSEIQDKQQLLEWVNKLENHVNNKIKKQSVPLKIRISELDNNNPEIKPTVRKGPAVGQHTVLAHRMERSLKISQTTQNIQLVGRRIRQANPRRGGRCQNCH